MTKLGSAWGGWSGWGRIARVARLAALPIVFVLLTLPTLGSSARAQSVSPRRMGVGWDDGVPRVTFSARDLVNRAVRDKLQSGLPQTITLRIYAYGHGRSEPVAVAPRSCRVVFDLWEEVYRVQLQTESSDRTLTVGSLDEVVERCLVVRRVAVGSRGSFARLGGRGIYFAVLVEFNPLSPDTVQRIRRWLARPGGRVEGDAFFGSFVSLFVNRRIGDAERTVRFRSQRVRVSR